MWNSAPSYLVSGTSSSSTLGVVSAGSSVAAAESTGFLPQAKSIGAAISAARIMLTALIVFFCIKKFFLS